MKRMIWLVLVLMLLTGCAAQPLPEASALEATVPEASVKTVSTVDEFLAAIAPNTEILLEAGTYDLSQASDYGMEAVSSYYAWEQVYDGYGLTIMRVDGLTIRGAGVEYTILSAEPGYADVLSFRSCDDVILEDFTAGHTLRPSECAGGVLTLEGCRNAQMNRLGLYGCGVVGIRTELCRDLRITDSDIYDCSTCGIVVGSTDNMTIDSCRIYDLGGEVYGGAQVFNISESSSVTVTNCEISDNNVLYLLDCRNADLIELHGNVFSRNRARAAAFNLDSHCLTLVDNTFEDNNLRCWYGTEIGKAMDETREKLEDEALNERYYQPSETVPAGEQTQVHVQTVDELLAAIAPDTEIILDAAFYDLSTAADYGEGTTDYYYWEEEFDGPNLVITGVNNLTIRSEDGKMKEHTISAIPRYAHVLTFSGCTNITLSGFTAGHTVEPGYCVGGVLMFRDSNGLAVENCGLYGCGVLGVHAEFCSNLQVRDCDIYECSYGGIYLFNVDGVGISGCVFWDLGGDSMSFSGCKNVVVNGEAMDGNAHIE